MRSTGRFFGALFLVAFVNVEVYATQVCQTATVTTPTGTSTERICVDNGVPIDFGPSGPTGPIDGGAGSGGGGSTTPTVTMPTLEQSKIAACAVNTFGAKDASGNLKYPLRSDYKIVYSPYFKWQQESTSVTRTTVDQISPGPGWVVYSADSDSPSYGGQKETTLYAHGYTETPSKSPLQELIMTLGHEAAHQNGVPGTKDGEVQAEAIGSATLDAYKAAKGAGCK